MNSDPELEGVSFLIWFDQGDEIRNTLGDLTFTGIFGAILASIVLFGFLRRFSMTVAAVLCIPFSIIVACGIIWAQGKTLNTLTLLGLIVGIGMLVDNAVVVMENIYPSPAGRSEPFRGRRGGFAGGGHRGDRGHPDLGDRLFAADLQQAQRDEHLSP